MSKEAEYFQGLLLLSEHEFSKIMLIYDLQEWGTIPEYFNDEQKLAIEAMLALAED